MEAFRLHAMSEIQLGVGNAFIELLLTNERSGRIEEVAAGHGRLLQNRGSGLAIRSNLVTGSLVEAARHDDSKALGFEAVRGGPDAIGGSIVVIAAFRRYTRRPCGRVAADVHLFALGHEGEAGEGIRVLAADQCADAAEARLRDAQARTVAGIPDQFLEECRHELAMM